MANALDVLDNERAAAKRHRQTLGRSGRDIRHHEAVYEVAVDLGATAMLNKIDLEIAGQRIIPVREGPDRHRAANRIPYAASTSAMTAESLFPHVPHQPVNGGGADLVEPLAQFPG